MSGELEYFDSWLITKGKVAVDNPSDLIDKELYHETRNVHINQGNYNENIERDYVQQFHSGSGDNIGRDKHTTNIYNSQNLTQAAADIQALLEQLDKTYDANSTTGKMTIATQAIETIDNDANLTQRIISALKSGSISALESLLDHPAASFVIAALEDWQNSKIRE